MKKIILYLLIFAFIGEIMLRFEYSYTFLEENRVVKIPTDIEFTSEYKLIKDNEFQFNDRDLRIMVIGDSYIHGGGIEFKDNFSQQLKRILKKKKSNFENIWMLDISRSNSNTLDNNLSYFQFVDKFRPHVVILGYNFDDIDGNLNKSFRNDLNVGNFKESHKAGKKANSSIEKIYKFIYKSKLINFIFRKTHSYIKTFGMVIPNSHMDLMIKSYDLNKEKWRKSKILLGEIIEDTTTKNIKFIIYKIPPMNLLLYPDLFLKSDNAIKLYFENYPSIIYRNGNIVTEGEDPTKYMLSKYDGHPNEKAHLNMAKEVFGIIDFHY